MEMKDLFDGADTFSTGRYVSARPTQRKLYLNTLELSYGRIRDRCVRPKASRDAASRKEKPFTVNVSFFWSSKIKHGSSSAASLLI